MFHRLILLILLCLPLRVFAENLDCEAVIAGYVSAVDTNGSFEVGGRKIEMTPKTAYISVAGKRKTNADALPPVYLGLGMDVCGDWHRKQKKVTATLVRFYPRQLTAVTGTAIIDLAPVAEAGVDGRVFRADGYLLRVSKGTILHLEPPLASLDQVGTNMWVDYHGERQEDGTVMVKEAYFQQNSVNSGELKMLANHEFNPATVDPAKAQDGLSRAFYLDKSRLPPHKDEDLQARVERIGVRLIPAYQAALPDGDATKIKFRFQVVDASNLRSPLSLANGIIQLPYAGVSRMQNDAQIAAEIADSMAEVLEKEDLRHKPAALKASIAGWSLAAGGIFAPGLGLAAMGPGLYQDHLIRIQQLQSSRVSLCLMHDAGYDLSQAPLAWWLLAPRKPKPLDQVDVPLRANYLYYAIGVAWPK